MPIIRQADAPRFEMPGLRVRGLASPKRGAAEISVWQLSLSPGTPHFPHSCTREEVFVATAGRASILLDGQAAELVAGDALVVPSGVSFSLANPSSEPFEAVVSFPVGGKAVTAQGEFYAPLGRMSGEPLDFGITLALAYSAFVDEMRAELAAAGHDQLHRSFGYVARAVLEQPLTLRELAERLAITPPGALKIVDEMERSGHLERVPDALDGRAKRLRLTRRGKAALGAARKFHARFEARLVAQLGAQKAGHCRTVLEAIIRERTLAGSPPALRMM